MIFKNDHKKLFIDASPLVQDHFSGVGHSLLGITTALDDIAASDKSQQISLIVPHGLGDRLGQFGFSNLEVLELPFSNEQIQSWQQSNRLPRLDRYCGRGVYFFPNFLSWPLFLSKSILMIHDISYELHPEFVHPPNRIFLSKMVPKSIKRSNSVATVSPNAKNEIAEFYKIDPAKIFVLANAVDQSVFYKRTSKEVAAIKKRYGVEGNYFVFVGNIEPRKNIERLVEAYTKLASTRADKTSLLLVGSEGWNNDGIKKKIATARKAGFKIIRPSKFVEDDDLPAIYSGAKALVYVPVYEGFGMPPLEAMACQTPVIASNVSSLPWVVGNAAISVGADNADQISQAMEEVLDQKVRQKLIQNGSKQIKKFSWHRTATTLLDIARKL